MTLFDSLCSNTSSGGADISPCGKYRYSLYRTWNETRPKIGWVMLNPSTADAKQDDPTIRKIIKFSSGWGYGGLTVVNLYAYRSAYPNILDEVTDPVGPENDKAIIHSLENHHRIMAAWGKHTGLRAITVCEYLVRTFARVYCLRKNNDGTPKHPLYIPRDTKPILFAGE